MRKPNILFVMTDQQRFDTIASLGNNLIYTPNFDRLVKRGLTFRNAYSTCPVCIAARYNIRTGREPPTTRIFGNNCAKPIAGQDNTMEGRCGLYLARTLSRQGYRTFGIGKFHTNPWEENLGYEVHLHSEEIYGTAAQRDQDEYASWIKKYYPEFGFIEQLMGERTEMYYIPQLSPLPAELNVERWVADRAVEKINEGDGRPFFGFVSFIGPHPPCAPPTPFNLLYNPDNMPNPIRGNIEVDHMDEQLPLMNHAIWADEINDFLARGLKARYYGEITYIDDCIGRILDTVESREDADNTLICFFSDHGDHLGDHHAWQKESFFEASCKIPFLLSWPARIEKNKKINDLVCLTDLFGIATSAAGVPEVRDGINVLDTIEGKSKQREHIVGYYGEPGTPLFKIMVRSKDWKYIYMSNGRREQLFDMNDDRREYNNLIDEKKTISSNLRKCGIEYCKISGASDALVKDGFRGFSYKKRERKRICQFDVNSGLTSFPFSPGEFLREYDLINKKH